MQRYIRPRWNAGTVSVTHWYEDHTGRETRFMIVADVDPGELGGYYTPPVPPSIEICEIVPVRYGDVACEFLSVEDRAFLTRVLLNKLDESDLQELVNDYLSED